MSVLYDVLGEKKKEKVMEDTWGHMKPRHGIRYPIKIVFAVCEYGETISVESTTPDSMNGGGPWFYNHLQWFLQYKNPDRKVGVYRFEGTYRIFKNGNCSFSGKETKIRI